LAPLELLIPGAIDRLLALINAYQARRKNLFAEHVQPLQDQMRRIHADYIAGFSEVKRLVEAGQAPPREVIDFLEERRRTSQQLRDETKKVADLLGSLEKRMRGDSVWPHVRTYGQAIVNYFSVGSGVADISWYTDFIMELRARVSQGDADVWASDKVEREELVQLLRGILDRGLPNAMGEINTYYAVLQTRLV
jgi:hypothetical protein